MNFIEFYQDKCDQCFKCLRVCPTKAIAFTEERREIIDELCIKCGLCHIHCAPKALSIHQDLRRVKHALRGTKKVAISIAPSYLGTFNLKSQTQIVSALRKLGFDYVEETARGAEIVSQHYDAIIEQGQMKNIITSCCPSSNFLIELYYPSAIKSVINIMSPMLAHGKEMRARYGDDVYVVFAGPCLAKKAEAIDVPNIIDAVITFVELEEWFKSEGIVISEEEEGEFDTPASKRGRAYPLGGSLWKNDLKTRTNPKYQYLHVDGIENCESFLKAIESDGLTGFCAELNICLGGCLNGPEMPANTPNYYKRYSLMKERIECSKVLETDEKELIVHAYENLDLKRTFKSRQNIASVVNQDQIANVLMEMGKYSLSDQINCGACGYTTCYSKAVAVTKGYSDINMCLERLKHKAESLQGIIFDSSPNLICILDEELRIKEVNPAFNIIFNQDKIKLNQWPLSAVIDYDIAAELLDSPIGRVSKNIYIDSVEKSFVCNVVKPNDGKVYVAIFTDISKSEQNRMELLRVKEKTLKTCQEVIDKQMRVAQEIASLLGETTAETKVGLNQLKKLVLTEGGV